MKILKVKFVLLFAAASIFSSCGISVSYLGETMSPTNNTDIFYDAKDVKKQYKVIGHLSLSATYNADQAKIRMVEKAKSVGADGVIILTTDYTSSKDPDPIYKGDAIKYVD